MVYDVKMFYAHCILYVQSVHINMKMKIYNICMYMIQFMIPIHIIHITRVLIITYITITNAYGAPNYPGTIHHALNHAAVLLSLFKSVKQQMNSHRTKS